MNHICFAIDFSEAWTLMQQPLIFFELAPCSEFHRQFREIAI